MKAGLYALLLLVVVGLIVILIALIARTESRLSRTLEDSRQYQMMVESLLTLQWDTAARAEAIQEALITTQQNMVMTQTEQAQTGHALATDRDGLQQAQATLQLELTLAWELIGTLGAPDATSLPTPFESSPIEWRQHND